MYIHVYIYIYMYIDIYIYIYIYICLGSRALPRYVGMYARMGRNVDVSVSRRGSGSAPVCAYVYVYAAYTRTFARGALCVHTADLHLHPDT